MKDSLQEQLITARRNQILDAAAIIFAAKGFHPTTIKDIAREAGIADGTIYNYFENKTALLIGIFERMREAVLQTTDIDMLPQTDFRAFLKSYLRHPLMALYAENFALFRVVVAEMMVNHELRTRYYQQLLAPTLRMAEAHFEALARQGIIKPTNITLTIRTISSLIFGLIFENILGDELLQTHWESLPDFLADLLMNGLQA